MLISPLMGPIIGAVGWWFQFYWKKSLKKFDSHFVGLVVSTLIFYVSPFKEAAWITISNFTHIYDILIAFLWFGCNSHYKE
jgi:hypothetical protein